MERQYWPIPKYFIPMTKPKRVPKRNIQHWYYVFHLLILICLFIIPFFIFKSFNFLFFMVLLLKLHTPTSGSVRLSCYFYLVWLNSCSFCFVLLFQSSFEVLFISLFSCIWINCQNTNRILIFLSFNISNVFQLKIWLWYCLISRMMNFPSLTC